MITLFSTGCPKCKILEYKLKEKNIPYYECDDIGIMEGCGVTSVPTLKINNKFLTFTDAVKWVNSQEVSNES